MNKLGWQKMSAIFIVVIGASMLVGYWLSDRGLQAGLKEERQTSLSEHEHSEKDATYVCPMMCIPPRSVPGNCPICGMELVPAFGVDTDNHMPRLKLSEEAIQLAEIETAPAERRFATAAVRLFGRIDYDPAHVTKLTAFMPGVIDRVYVKRAGQFVRWGDPLFDLYSSDLLETQQQLVEVMRYVPSFMAFQAGLPHAAREMPVQERASSGDTSGPEAEAALKKLAAIRHKLRILGLPKRDIDELMKKGEATGIATIYSSVYGQVIDQQAFEGTFVNTGTPIFTIGDPNYVWVKLDAYESDYPWLRKGQDVVFETDAYPGETFAAKVVYIDPVFNNATRTFTLGALSPETGGKLKAGMLVRATIHARLTADGNVAGEDEDIAKAPLVIPASAPLITGKRAVVYVKSSREAGRFEGREIVLGPRAGNYYLVLAGVNEGDLVVKNGNFKIDSALQIQARPSLMSVQGGHSAVDYHRPGGSEILERDYLNKRAGSRDAVMRDRESEIKNNDDTPPEKMVPPGRRSIQRRRPGAYGDITRQRQRGSR